MMITTQTTDFDLVSMVFADIITGLGFDAWYECESQWNDIEDVMLEMGLDEEIVSNYFAEMSWEL